MDFRKCDNCGNQVNSNDNICSNCGNPLNQNISNKDNQINTNKKKKIPNILKNGMFICIGFVLGITPLLFKEIKQYDKSNQENNQQQNQSSNNGNYNDTVTKNYNLEKIDIDNCKLDNITFIGDFLVIANDTLYRYSNKKYVDTNTYCKAIDTNIKNYIYIGRHMKSIYLFKSNEYVKMVDLENQTDHSLNEFYSQYANVDSINSGYNYLFYLEPKPYLNEKIGVYIKDNEILVDNQKLLIPNNEMFKDIYIINDNMIQKEFYLVTDNNIYLVGFDKDDKCYEYNDLECSYVIKETNIFIDLLKNFKNNISYFNGNYLVTKNNDIFRVTYN